MVILGIIEHLKERARHDRLYRAPPDQGLKGFLKRRLTPPRVSHVPQRRINIFLNRYCNLECFSCGALGMRPPPDETSILEIGAFLRNLGDYSPGSTIMLTGGEPTAVQHGKLKTVCSMIHDHGYKVALLTNGFKLIPVEWADYIILDKHGINDADISKWETHLEEAGRDIDYREKYFHMDIPYSMDGNITKGARCSNWVDTLTLWKDVVYPCCNMMCVSWWHNDYGDLLAPALRRAGWSADNSELADDLLAWRITLPGEAYRTCMTHCWRDAPRTRWVKIGTDESRQIKGR